MADDDQAEGQTDNLKDLRRAADEARQARAEADKAVRELAFVKAGVDVDSKLGQLLLKTYDGDLTVDAIRAEATELGAIKAPTTDAAPEREDPNERRQTRERQDLAAESGSPSDHPEDPYDSAYTAFEAARKKGERRETAAAAAYQKILEAASRGDERVFVDPAPNIR